MIKFHCEHCHQKLGVPESFAGKRVRCTSCSQAAEVPPLEIPASHLEPLDNVESEDSAWTDEMFGPQDQPDNYGMEEQTETSQFHTCPTCDHECEPDCVFCVNCGYDFRSGQNRQVKIQHRKSSGRSKIDFEDKSHLVKLIAQGAVVVFLVGLLLWAFNTSNKEAAAMVGLWGGIIIAGVGRIWFLVVAYQESTLWGVCCFFVPFAEVIFFFTHLEDTWRPTVVYILGIVILFGTVFGVAVDTIGDAFDYELTEEEIQELINDQDYLFDVACWHIDQQGAWDEYDVQYDGEFADSLSSYRNGWMDPPTNRAELVREQIQYVEGLVKSWTEQERREKIIARNDYQKQQFEETKERIFDTDN